MKKSRIIFPALAMLTLSVAASVTGTVAWFTASRTANMSLSNLAAINTAGDLTLTLTKGNQKDNAKNDSKIKTLALEALRDASYNINHNNNETGVFYPGLDSEGKFVQSTIAVANQEEAYGTFGDSKKVYFTQYFTGTFTTKSINTSYLYFNTNINKSKIEPTGLEASATLSNSIYASARVAMEANTYAINDTEFNNSLDTKKVVWAPYTILDDTADMPILSITKAGILNKPYTVDNKVVSSNSETTTYVKKVDYKEKGQESSYLADQISAGDTTKVVKTSTTDPVDVSWTNAAAEKADMALSTKLTKDSLVKVKFTIWFEGLDPNCIATAAGVNEIGGAVSAAISMGFYAIDNTTFVGA